MVIHVSMMYMSRMLKLPENCKDEFQIHADTRITLFADNFHAPAMTLNIIPVHLFVCMSH